MEKLKNGTDEHDPYYIHKVNCCSINGEPSFLFKTSRKAAELAIKMDINMQKEGFLSAMTEEYAFLDGMHSHTKLLHCGLITQACSRFYSYVAWMLRGRTQRMLHCS